MIIDEIAYELYKNKCDRLEYDYIYFNIFIERKYKFQLFYDEAIIIERKYKLNKIMK